MYLKSNYSRSIQALARYVFDEAAHDGTKHRVISTTGDNVHLWGSDERPYRSQSGYFIARQFGNIRHRAKNQHKHHQAQHLILSFAESEFQTDDNSKLLSEADQINALVKGFMQQHFSNETQWVSAVQADGDGHKLHAHVIVNSVQLTGQVVQGVKFSVFTLRHQLDHYLEKNYQRITGKVYQNPNMTVNDDPTIKYRHGWQHDLQQQLATARERSSTVDEYVETLKQQGITITERNQVGDWSYHVIIDGKQKTVRDFYQRKDKQTGEVKSTRGIGKAYTPSSLQQYFEYKHHQRTEVKSNEQNSGRAKPVVSADNGLNRTIINDLNTITSIIDAKQRQRDDLNSRNDERQRRDNGGPDTGH